MNISPIIKYRTLAIAKALAPFDTGNLRHNAIKLKSVKPNSWRINYSDRQASYIAPLQNGWVNSKTGEVHDMHKGFIDKTVFTLTSYLYNELNGRKQNTSRYLREALSTSKNSWNREMVNMRSKLRYSEYRKLEKGE